ncbi:MAG: hypothetical protein IJN54_00895 [Lachnospiraceae bacterium]|nr:hypothetical protein [Lachnospiraceae bacterium]
MSELLVEIFNHLLERDEDAKEMQNKVNLELERMLIPYKNKFTEEEKEKAYTFLYDIVYISEREAVLYGIKLMMKLFLEL